MSITRTRGPVVGTELPSLVESGEPARLIPVVSDTSKEQRIASVLLAGMQMLPPFAGVLLSSVGQRVGKRTRVRAFTEIVPKCIKRGEKDRPDGLLMLETGRRSWSALFEIKQRKNQLESAQVERYVKLARLNGLDAVITVSNQFTARPDHHPLQLAKNRTGKVGLYHWSWMWIFTQASLLDMDDSVENPDQALLLRELVRFFGHSSAGIDGFDQMNREWKDVVRTIESRTALRRTAPEVESTVASWHEEERDLCLIMARHLGQSVRLKLDRKHRDAPLERLKDDCAKLADEHILECTLQIPNAAGDLVITVDMKGRTISCSMQVETPKDKKSTKARVNWLLRQIAKADDPDLFVSAVWPSRAPNTTQPLDVVRGDPTTLQTENRKLAPRALEVRMVRQPAGKFAGSRKFIEYLEEAVPTYYDQVAQHLRPWQPAPPKPRDGGVISRGEQQVEPQSLGANDSI